MRPNSSYWDKVDCPKTKVILHRFMLAAWELDRRLSMKNLSIFNGSGEKAGDVARPGLERRVGFPQWPGALGQAASAFAPSVRRHCSAIRPLADSVHLLRHDDGQ